MPKTVEEALKRRARQLGYKPGSDRYNRYVYGSLEKLASQKKGSDKA